MVLPRHAERLSGQDGRPDAHPHQRQEEPGPAEATTFAHRPSRDPGRPPAAIPAGAGGPEPERPPCTGSGASTKIAQPANSELAHLADQSTHPTTHPVPASLTAPDAVVLALQGRSEAGRVEAERSAEAERSEAGRVGADRVEPGRSEAGQGGADRVEPGRSEAGQGGAGPSEARRVGADWVEPGRSEAGRSEARRVEADRVEPERSGAGLGSAAAARVARTLRLVVGEWRWPVVPGVQLTRAGACSCGEYCAEPGAHPVDTASWLAASADPDRIREWWLAAPLAAIVLPVGWHVDVIDAPESGGREALGRLEMMGYRPAPAISTASGRLLFLVAAGARRTADFAERGRGRSRKRPVSGGASLPTQPGPETGLWLGGDCSGAPDIVVRRRGVLVLPPIGPEPPGVTRWLVEPDQVRRPLPRAEDLLGPIVHACRDVVARHHRGIRADSPARPLSGPIRPTSTVDRAQAAPPAGPSSSTVDGEPAGVAAGPGTLPGFESPVRPAGVIVGGLPATGPWSGRAAQLTSVAECALVAGLRPGQTGMSPSGPWQPRTAASDPGRPPVAVAPALAGAARAVNRRAATADGQSAGSAPAAVATAALSAAHRAAAGAVPPPARSVAGSGPAHQGDGELRAGGPRTVPRRAGSRSTGRPANGATDRRAASRRSEVANTAWKERLRRVRPEPPPAPA